MEALTAVDVNTGRFVGKKSLEDTITQTNLEAAREVAEQLRIRSIGGMIVVDFIDMDRASNRDKVMRSFNDVLKRDRNKATVTRISELGLVEMTRKRTRESLLHHLTEPCAQCEGKGYTKSRRTIAYELLRELRRQGGLLEGDTVIAEVHPDVAQSLATTDRTFLEDTEKRLQKRIIVKGRGSFHMEDFEIRTPGEKPIEKSEFASGQGDRAESRPAQATQAGAGLARRGGGAAGGGGAAERERRVAGRDVHRGARAEGHRGRGQRRGPRAGFVRAGRGGPRRERCTPGPEALPQPGSGDAGADTYPSRPRRAACGNRPASRTEPRPGRGPGSGRRGAAAGRGRHQPGGEPIKPHG